MGNEELTYRQAVRNIDRTFAGGMRRNQRKTFERFLTHANPRISEYAKRIKLELENERKRWQEAFAAEVSQQSKMICDDLNNWPEWIKPDAEMFP